MAKSNNTTNRRSKALTPAARERRQASPHSSKAPATPAGSSKRLRTKMFTQSASVSATQTVPVSAKRSHITPHKFEGNDDRLLGLCQQWHRLNAEYLKAERADE